MENFRFKKEEHREYVVDLITRFSITLRRLAEVFSDKYCHEYNYEFYTQEDGQMILDACEFDCEDSKPLY